ncbi:response regulator transcription factor [Chryseolinea soli]|uniref:DNA-binding response regulator n=1 Tax=Chryseolinea soli TaxID=2321403 RepID=A0A385SK98_9BACT|nr:response regulator transcription factor [Chryseolinea soli]AYB30355.1 DNA-binding response regulator [Chryseolinea soli]
MKKTKILYVEDEPFLGRIVKESLESRDFEVAMITDGNDAAAAFKELLPDICVLDIMLPSKDGYAIAKEIRQIAAGMPIIFVTAKVQTEDLLRGFEVGGNDYLRKPFSMEELIVRINNLLQLTRVQKNGSSSQEVVAIGQYHFIPLRYELRLGDRTRQLSHRESTLLQALIDNKNATALRKDILLKLWGDDSFFNSRNLDVYITKLRDYLKEDPSIKIITIKGIGYHFSVG